MRNAYNDAQTSAHATSGGYKCAGPISNAEERRVCRVTSAGSACEVVFRVSTRHSPVIGQFAPTRLLSFIISFFSRRSRSDPRARTQKFGVRTESKDSDESRVRAPAYLAVVRSVVGSLRPVRSGTGKLATVASSGRWQVRRFAGLFGSDRALVSALGIVSIVFGAADKHAEHVEHAESWCTSTTLVGPCRPSREAGSCRRSVSRGASAPPIARTSDGWMRNARLSSRGRA